MVTGIPAAIAFLITALSAGVFGSVTAIPSTFLSMAAWISWACLVASGSEEYWTSMLSFVAAAVAPLRMRSQKVSPGAAWVIIATVSFGPAAAAPAAGAAADEVSAALPPEDEQAVRASAAASAVTAPTTCLERFMIGCLSNSTATSRRCPGWGWDLSGWPDWLERSDFPTGAWCHI